MMIRFFLSGIVLLGSLGGLFSQSAPKYSNEFLSIGVGARSQGMANSTIASSTDATANYWNPANMLNSNKYMQLGLQHAEFFAGIAKYDFVGGNYKINKDSYFGASLIRYGVDNIPNTLELIDAEGNLRYDRITSFSVVDYGLLFSYARNLNIKGLQVGGNVKIIRRVAGDFAQAWGFGIDVAGTYLYNNFKFAAVVRDVTTTFNAWSFNTDQLKDVFVVTGNEIPENSTEITLPKIILGGGYYAGIGDKFSVYPEINIDISTDRKRNVLIKSNPFSIDPHMGLELGYKKIVYLRGGIGNIQQETDKNNKKSWIVQPNFGLGLHIKNFTIDYALTSIGKASATPYSNIFSIGYFIDKK